MDSITEYTYNAMGARVQNVQVRENVNAGHGNTDLKDGSHDTDYLDYLSDLRNTWQKTWESEVGTIHQNNLETVTTDYIVDYTSIGNRDLLATEQGSLTKRYVYDANGQRISAEFSYAPDTQRGQPGENIATDFGVERSKVWYRTSHLGSTLFTVDADGNVIGHTIYDPWGKPLTETTVDINNSGMDNANNYTGYTYDVVLGLYFAQNRFYDPANHRFTQEDIVKDGGNWYVYVGNSPMMYVDAWGLFLPGTFLQKGAYSKDVEKVNRYLYLNEYLTYDEYNASQNMYTIFTDAAVKKFQKTNKMYVANGVNQETWEKMGFEVNQTLAEEFFSGTKGNDVISMTIQKNTVIISYYPTFYACKNGSAGESVTDLEFHRYMERAIEGFKQWEKSSVWIQGINAKVVVNVIPTQAKIMDEANIKIYSNKSGSSLVPTAVGWKTWKHPVMYLSDAAASYNDSKFVDGSYQGDRFSNDAAHEFGHVLGLWDAYGYGSNFNGGDILWPEAPADRASKNNVMRSEGPVQYRYDSALYEMMLYAWSTNSLQLFTDSSFGTASNAFYS